MISTSILLKPWKFLLETKKTWNARYPKKPLNYLELQMSATWVFLHQPRRGKEFKICSTVLHRCWLDKASINFLQLLLWVLILLIRGVDVVLDASKTQCWLRCYGQARVFWISQMITYGLTWENRRHFVTPPVVFPRNNVWGMSAEFHTDEASLPRSG